MLKIVAFVALVLCVAASIVSASQRSRQLSNSVPKLHNHKKHSSNVKASTGDSRLIQLQRCNNTDCTGCETIMEFQPGVCHNNIRFFDHGEILRCQPAAQKKQCFTETAYLDRFHTGQCEPTTMVESGPREFDVCRQDVFGDPLQFFKYKQSGNTITMYRGCDYQCGTCDVIIPITVGQCTQLNGPFLHDFTFQITNVTSCSPDIKADHFFSPSCDGEPNFVDEVYTDRCYFFAGRQHRYQCK